MKNLLMCFAGIMFFVAGYAQAPLLKWEKSFSGNMSSFDSASVIKMYNADGSIYIAGTSDAYGTSNDILLIKRDFATGDTVWTRRYNGSANSDDQTVDMEINQATGDIYITGKSLGTGTAYDIITIKYSSSGILGWANRWNNTYINGDDIPKDIGIDNRGNIYVSAYTFNGSTGFAPTYEDLLVLVYNSAGTLTNYKKEDITSYKSDWILDAIVSNNGDVIMAGEYMYGTLSFGYSYVYVCGVKSSLSTFYPSSWGDITSIPVGGTKAVSTPDDFTFYNAMDIDNSNNVYIASVGDTIYKTGSYYKVIISKINSTGTIVWENKSGGSLKYQNIKVTVLKVDPNNSNVYAAGYESNANGNFDWFLIKYNSSGVFQWKVNKNGTDNGDDFAYDIAFDKLQNPIVVGNTRNASNNYDLTFIKYNKTTGNEIYEVNYNSKNRNQTALNIIVDANQNIILNGLQRNDSYDFDIITLRYCDPVDAAGIISGKSTVCQGESNVSFSVPTISGASSYVWTLPIGVTGSSTANSILVNFGDLSESGYIKVKGHNDCRDGAESLLSIIVNLKPSTPIISQSGDTLISNAIEGNQWYYNNSMIDGATNQKLKANKKGQYYTIITSPQGCVSEASNIIDPSITRSDGVLNKNIKIYPNPTSGIITFSNLPAFNETEISIVDMSGSVIIKQKINSETASINISHVTPGSYLLNIDGQTDRTYKIIKE